MTSSAFALLHEDERLWAIAKPAGMVVNRPDTRQHPSVLDALPVGARLVHRLDRDTTGVLIVAKSRAVATELSAAFAERRVEKQYWAVVTLPRFGANPLASARWVEAPIGRDPRRPQARAVRSDGQPARTQFLPRAILGPVAWVEARPETGRTHQLRVHLSHLGCPILGDGLYGGGTTVCLDDATPFEVSSMMLHARRISFRLQGQSYAIEAPAPDAMRRLGTLGLSADLR